MTIIELYINNRLCDVGRDFGVRLNRQLLNPGELNTKDAQYSYSITLPPTSNNNTIFNYANIEETSNKFNREYHAELIINSLRVFTGLFRLSEVTQYKYKGNLYIPATKSIKDIFGELKLNENPEYRIEFKDFAEYISYYNTLAANGPQIAIFPYTLYGVLPKVPVSRETDNYTPPDVWDSNVRMGMQDLAPSVNPLLILKHIFTSQGYNLVGTAFEDERLTRLYMSYKNDTDYVQPWNYGYHGQINLKGEWSNVTNMRTNEPQLERGVFETYEDDGAELYACDLFDCNNTVITEKNDPGGNVLYSEVIDADNRTWARTQIRIPATGYYKINLTVSTQLIIGNSVSNDPVTGIQFVSALGSRSGYDYMRSAVKLLRDRKNGDFGISSSRMDGALYKDNLPQNNVYDAENTPKYMPKYRGPGAGSIVFVDLAQNEKHIAGFQCGKRNDDDVIPNFTGIDIFNDNTAKITAAKPAISWDNSRTGDIRNRLAIDNSGYNKYTLPDESSEESTDTPQWTNSNRFSCKILNSPNSNTRRGYYNGSQAEDDYSSEGSLSCVVWLEAGELLTLSDVSDKCEMRRSILFYRGWIAKNIIFDLNITPFRTNQDWLKIDDAGIQIPNTTMNWDDPTNFDVDSIDLIRFLPADMKTDDFIDNFCKAFNLQLTQINATTFEMNVKQSKTAVSNLFINLDNFASVHDRSNTPLGLPSLYKLGFTVDVEEEGYVTTGDDGGGEFETGVTEDKIVEQKSNFSFNWFKNITKHQPGGNIIMPLAIISKHDVWELPYPDAMNKRYSNQALRFWYPDGLLNDLGATFEFNNKQISIIKVSNELTGLSTLSYKNHKLTILDNYFTILINGSSHYTEVEGYLTPYQYEQLNGAIMAMFNGDIYYIAEISGYDPAGRNKSKIKLIRRI